MYPITNEVKALFEAEQRKVLRITGKPLKKDNVSVGPSSIVTVNDAAAIPAKDITIAIEPVQSGSGDPSPTNVRPISGWTGANVVVSNVAPNADKTITIESIQQGTGDPSPTNVRPILPGLTFQRDDETTLAVYGGTLDVTTGVLTVDMGMVDLGTLNWRRNGLNFQFYSDPIANAVTDYSGRNVICSCYTGGNAYIISRNYFICIGEKLHRAFVLDDRYTDDATFKAAMSGVQLVYELATPQTYQLTPTEVTRALSVLNNAVYPISWQSEAGTIYGGTLDVTTGLLTVDRGYDTYNGTENIWVRSFRYPGSFYTWRYANRLINAPEAICSHARYNTFTNYDVGMFGWDGSLSLFLMDDPNATVDDFKNYLAAQYANGTPVQICYELATPRTYQLTPNEVTLLLGVNNVWADTGDMTLIYRPYADLIITDDNVIADSFQIDRYSCNGEKLEIGTAIAAQMTMTLENGNGTYDDIAFEGAELFVEVGVADWTQSSPTVHWIPCGYFTPDEQPRRLSTISITALDRMTKFDAVVDGTQITTPITVANLVVRICTLQGVTLTQSITGLPNANVSLTSIPTGNTVTYRNLIAWCAGIMGTNAWFDWNGQLRFSWYANATGYASTIDNRYSSDMYENDLTVTGVKYTTTGGIDIVEGTDDYAIELTGNALASPMIAIILPALNTALNGFTYRPFTVAVVNAPYLWPMDTVTFTDKDGNDHTSALTNVCFGLNGTTALESRGMTYILNRQKSPEGFTKEQAQLVNQAMEQVETNIDESLTQQEIFNRLTDDGAAQGLVLLNGQLYINASYINAGMLSVGRIGFNDVEGHYSVPNENDPDSLLPGEAISGGWIVSTDSTNQIIRLLGCDYAVPLRGQTITLTFTYKTRIENGVSLYRTFESSDGAYVSQEEFWFPETEPPYVPPNPYTYTYTVPNDAENLMFYVYGCDGVKNISVSVSGTPITPPTIKFDYSGLKIGNLLINRDGNVILDGYFHISKPICFSNDVTLYNALSVGSGGTGITSNPSMLVNLGSGNAANVFQASPRPGVTGTLGVGNGGTGAANAADARTNLGITPANIGAVSKNGDTISGDLTVIGNLYMDSADYAAIGDLLSNALIAKTRDGTVFMQSSGYASVYVYDNGDALIQSESGAASIHLSSDGDINVSGDVTLNNLLEVQYGGTGASNAAGARSNLGVPSTTGSGASGSWGINVTGSAGSVAAGNISGTVAVDKGGTGATSKSGARTNLGIKYLDVNISVGSGSKNTGLNASTTQVIAALCINAWASVCDISGVHPNNGTWHIVCEPVQVNTANVRVFYFD